MLSVTFCITLCLWYVFSDYQEEALCRAEAGSVLRFVLKASDQFNNMHTTGGAVSEVTIQGGGKRTSPDGSRAEDAVCETRYVSDGKYELKCQVFSMGLHDVVVTDSCLRSSVLGRVRVSCGPPHGAHCRLSDSNTYSAMLGTRHSLSVELFDAFRNPTHCSDSYMVIRMAMAEAHVGNQVLEAFTAPDAVRYGYFSCRSTRFLVFSFVPHETGQSWLDISINGTHLSACPVPFTVHVSAVMLKSKFQTLRSYLSARHCKGYTPTLTVHRERLLESTVEVLQEHHFSKIVRVRFGEEIGLDMGGISRY